MYGTTGASAICWEKGDSRPMWARGAQLKTCCSGTSAAALQFSAAQSYAFSAPKKLCVDKTLMLSHVMVLREDHRMRNYRAQHTKNF